MDKFDSKRWIELSYIDDCKILNKYSIQEYYSKANQGLYEFLDPGLSYEYEEVDRSQEQKLWVVEKIGDDPQFLVTLKIIKSNEYFVLDFYFYETGMKKNQGLTGENYLDTLCKIVKDNIVPYFIKSPRKTIYFSTYTEDGAGNARKKAFTRIVDKFFDKNKFNIKIDGYEFFITKK